MNKGLMYFSVIAFSTAGSYVPALWHAGMFSIAGILGGLIGAGVGVWAGVKLGNYFG